MLSRPSWVAVALTAAMIVGCQGGRRGPPPERFVPADATAAVIVGETGRAARELAALHETISGFPGAGGIAGARGALAAQLGFDPLDPDALADAGVDARRGAAIATLVRRVGAETASPRLVVLPARDVAKLEGLLARLARDRLGATERSAEVRGGVAVTVLRTPGSRAPALAYAIAEATALVCTGPAGPALVAEAAALRPEASLSAAHAWGVARRALGDDLAASVFVPPGSPLLGGAWPLADGVAVGVNAARGRLLARTAMLLGAREPSFRALAAGGAAKALVERLDPQAPLAARWDGDLDALGQKLVPMLPARERARLAARGVDPARDLFGVLAPGAAVALSLAPGLELAGLSGETFRDDPLRVFAFEAILPVREAAAAAAASDALERGRARAKPQARPRVHRLRTGSGEIAWIVDDAAKRIVAAGGPPGRLDALLARLQGDTEGFDPPTRAAEAALSGGLGGAVVNAPRLVASVRALPDAAFGTGPTGFVVRSVVDRIVDPAARLAAVSLRADLAEGALVVALEVEAQAAEGR